MIPVLIAGAVGGYIGSKIGGILDERGREFKRKSKSEATTRQIVSEKYVMDILKKSGKKLHVD